MKNKRQEKILQLIERYEIGSQSDLSEMLHSYGCFVKWKMQM